MNTIRFRLLVATLAVLLGSAIARSQTPESAPAAPPMHGHRFAMHGSMMMGFFSKQLNLTEDQKTQMHSILRKERPTMKPLFEQAHQVDLQLRQVAEGSFETAKVQALAAQKSQIQTQLTVEETRIHSELYQVLTADQQNQLKQLEAEHEARMQTRMQQHQPPSEE
jgi:periplasmic protein CpxP/Spy